MRFAGDAFSGTGGAHFIQPPPGTPKSRRAGESSYYFSVAVILFQCSDSHLHSEK